MTESRARRSRKGPITIAGVEVPPGRRRTLELPAGRLVTGTAMGIPAAVINGRGDGPTLWLTGAIHGDELNGVEIVRSVIAQVSPTSLNGCIVAVPIVNVFGFLEGSRYLPDRRDLNRSFPGSARGSLAGRLARLIMENVVVASDVGIDFHTGTWHRRNVPHIRTDLDSAEGRKLAETFGTSLILHARERDGSLREAAKSLGKTVLVFEGGEAHRFDAHTVDAGVFGTLRVLGALGMLADVPAPAAPPVVLAGSSWVRARRAGILRLGIEPGARVGEGEIVGEIGDAIGGRPARVRAPRDGWVVGVLKNPLVNRGDAVVHIGYEPD